jgi:Phage tail lysozyme
VAGLLAAVPHSWWQGTQVPHSPAHRSQAATAALAGDMRLTGDAGQPWHIARAIGVRHLTASAQATPSPARPAVTAAPRQQVVSCSGGAGLLPANTQAIVSFLRAHGYTGNAAAGIAGNIYQESGGNPESVGTGGGGLIGWTPLPAGLVTGNPTADLRAQLTAILSFNQLWAQYIPALNGASSPAAAADIYVTDFERAGIPAAGNREAAAAAVATACGL